MSAAGARRRHRRAHASSSGAGGRRGRRLPLGIAQRRSGATWGIYLVNLLFWSSLAITGPALAGMMQMTEARWSPSVKRLALTTAGFLPVSFVGS